MGSVCFPANNYSVMMIWKQVMTGNNWRRGSKKVKDGVINKGEERKGKGTSDRGSIVRGEIDLFYGPREAEAWVVANKTGYLKRRWVSSWWRALVYRWPGTAEWRWSPRSPQRLETGWWFSLALRKQALGCLRDIDIKIHKNVFLLLKEIDSYDS